MKTILMKTSLSDGKTAKHQYTVTDDEADKLIEVGFAELVAAEDPDGASDVPPKPDDSAAPDKPDGKQGKRS